MGDNVSAFEIIDFTGFYESLVNEAFSDSALLVGRRFFRKSKKDMDIFKKHVVEKKTSLIPEEKYIVEEIAKHLFATEASGTVNYILPKDMEIVISNLSNEITYKIMSNLTNTDIMEMCYSPEDDDIIWRIKK